MRFGIFNLIFLGLVVLRAKYLRVHNHSAAGIEDVCVLGASRSLNII